jgi:chaperonin GroEL (HSP60 family)
MPVKEVSDRLEGDQHLAALITNAGAIRAVTETVEGTLGPKGLDCMLIDPYGSILITNDGVAILRAMDIQHPAARVLIGAAEQQDEQVGDGTTTATVIAGSLIVEGANQVVKGVPAIKVVEGIRSGIAKALQLLEEAVVPLPDLQSPVLLQLALIAARENREIAELAVNAARIVGAGKLQDSGFKLAEQVVALEGPDSCLIQGTIINREPLNKEMPRRISPARIIIFDDALEPVEIDSDALRTEAGFEQQIHNKREFEANLEKLAVLGVNAIFTDRGISAWAEDWFTEAGILGVQRVARDEWQRLAAMCGARPLKRTGLARPVEDLRKVIGETAAIDCDPKYRQIRVTANPSANFVTIVIGATTKTVVEERERIARDTAAAVQAAWRGGVVPGGGATELGIAGRLGQIAERGMASYGFSCVREALQRPMTQICRNAGFNPLEKITEALARLTAEGSFSYGVNCETGAIEDLTVAGIWDPYYVKYYAIKSAGEVSEAILRINTMIKMKEARITGSPGNPDQTIYNQ